MTRERSLLAHDVTAARRMFVATKPKTIDEYLARLSPEDRAALQKVRRAVHAAAPGAEECVSYGMPRDEARATRLRRRYVAVLPARTNCSNNASATSRARSGAVIVRRTLVSV